MKALYGARLPRTLRGQRSDVVVLASGRAEFATTVNAMDCFTLCVLTQSVSSQEFATYDAAPTVFTAGVAAHVEGLCHSRWALLLYCWDSCPRSEAPSSAQCKHMSVSPPLLLRCHGIAEEFRRSR